MDVSQRASGLQRTICWIIIGGVLLGAAYGTKLAFDGMTKPRPLVQLGQATFRAEVAKTSAEREQGLAGRTELAGDQALLLVFETNDHWGVWMKGMRIPIDIVWLDEYKKVVHVQQQVWPDGEPHETYRPPKPARYVLELAAGSAKQHAIRVGAQARFSLEDKT